MNHPARAEAAEPYAAAWAHYRRLRRRKWVIGLSLILIIPGSAVLSGIFDGGTAVSDGLTSALLLVWFFTLLSMMFRQNLWRCPRCSQRFFIGPPVNNPLARKCLHCGLPKWAVSDSHAGPLSPAVTSRRSTDPELDEHERKAVQNVEIHGLHIIHVSADGDGPGWSYSVGLWRNYKHPELVVFGLNREVGHHLLNHAADEIRAGRPFVEEGEYADLLEGVRCMFRPVAPLWHYPLFGWAEWFYGDEEYPVLQCIWPDHDENWPWDPGFPRRWLWAQPLLWRTDVDDARMRDTLESMGL